MSAYIHPSVFLPAVEGMTPKEVLDFLGEREVSLSTYIDLDHDTDSVKMQKNNCAAGVVLEVGPVSQRYYEPLTRETLQGMADMLDKGAMYKSEKNKV